MPSRSLLQPSLHTYRTALGRESDCERFGPRQGEQAGRRRPPPPPPAPRAGSTPVMVKMSISIKQSSSCRRRTCLVLHLHRSPRTKPGINTPFPGLTKAPLFICPRGLSGGVDITLSVPSPTTAAPGAVPSPPTQQEEPGGPILIAQGEKKKNPLPLPFTHHKQWFLSKMTPDPGKGENREGNASYLIAEN